MKFIAEYIWLDSSDNIHSKSRTIEIECTEEDARSGKAMSIILNTKTYKDWNYDGSSTGDAVGHDSEIIIKPVAVYPDPFRKLPNVLLLCDTYLPDNSPTSFNTRHSSLKIFNQYKSEKPWFGLEQEFFIMVGKSSFWRSDKSCVPYGTKKGSLNDEQPQGQYYCSVGYQNAFGRKITEKAYHLALEANVKCSGMNSEVAPGQWEIQVGPCEGISAGDNLILLRYILQRVGEQEEVQITLHPKPIEKGEWNGSGCHTNFSTQKMRAVGGYDHIITAIGKLRDKHLEHMGVYGKDNELRCSGKLETSDYQTFSYGVADRGASIRIPRETERLRTGYFEDRRPASNMDPYLVTSKILETVMGDEIVKYSIQEQIKQDINVKLEDTNVELSLS